LLKQILDQIKIDFTTKVQKMKSSMKIAFNLVVVIIPCETEKELK
jgi:hypothetical protein